MIAPPATSAKTEHAAPAERVDQHAADERRDHRTEACRTWSGRRSRGSDARPGRRRARSPAPASCRSRRRSPAPGARAPACPTVCATAEMALPTRNSTRPVSRTGRRPKRSDKLPYTSVAKAMANSAMLKVSCACASRQRQLRLHRRNHRQEQVHSQRSDQSREGEREGKQPARCPRHVLHRGTLRTRRAKFTQCSPAQGAWKTPRLD